MSSAGLGVVRVEVEVPAEDVVGFEAFVRGVAAAMAAGVGKGYSPRLSSFIGTMLQSADGGVQYWQGCEAVAKTVRGCAKIEAGDMDSARSDFEKVAAAAYTMVRDFCGQRKPAPRVAARRGMSVRTPAPDGLI